MADREYQEGLNESDIIDTLKRIKKLRAGKSYTEADALRENLRQKGVGVSYDDRAGIISWKARTKILLCNGVKSPTLTIGNLLPDNCAQIYY